MKIKIEVEANQKIKDILKKVRYFYLQYHLDLYENNKSKTARIMGTSRAYLNKCTKKQ